ncbi:hypothetical protein MKW92_025314 [Papaver armeniacum]|nr:hypothetical protein MKW92_025314 [Papaver armeniacum]
MGIGKNSLLGKKPFSFLSKDFERKIGEHSFNRAMKIFKGKTLPETHPKSVRVRLIAKDIIEASQRELKYEQHHNEVHDDDKGVQERRSSSSKLATYHLEGLNWEILVVDEPIVNAFCSSGGKIVVFTGLLNVLRTDAEIATIIGHEVGHVVARHAAEIISINMCFQILKMTLRILLADLMTNLNELDNYLLDLPFSRRMETEADYIGLLLLASAGYDPRIAPRVCEKLGELVDGGSLLEDYLYTHPSGKKRAQLLSQDRVMEEALCIYKELNSCRGIERQVWFYRGFWDSVSLLCITIVCIVLLCCAEEQ